MLSHAAARARVRRLLHVSSIRAMGEFTLLGAPFRATDTPLPRDPYGDNKQRDRNSGRKAGAEPGVELVIRWPPLVDGPGVKGNFRALLRIAGSGLPLPFAGVDNRRSLIFLDNLVDLAAQHACTSRCRRPRSTRPRRGRLVHAGVDPAARRRVGSPGAALPVTAIRLRGASKISGARAADRATDGVAASR